MNGSRNGELGVVDRVVMYSVEGAMFYGGMENVEGGLVKSV